MSNSSRTCSRSPNWLNEKIDRLLALQEKVERNSQAITRLKTIWSIVAASIALVVAVLKDWLFR